MSAITAAPTLEEIAALVSHDLDFVTSERNEVLARALIPLGFRRVAGARQFEHPESEFFL